MHLPVAITAAVAALILSSPAAAKRRVEVLPYVGIDQTLVADLSGGASDDTVTYTSVRAGVDVSIKQRSSELRANLAYQHQFSWRSSDPDQDVITGLASGRVDLVRGKLSLEGGGLATRVRTDGLTGANGSLLSSASQSQIYSIYAGPTWRSRVGDLEVNAAYRLGYNRLEDGTDAAILGTTALDSFSESWTHYATASLGMQPGTLLPVGWALGGGYQREDASQLDQRFEDKWGRLDLTLPLTLDLAAIGGVGYEAIKISNRDALRDPTTGDPIRDSHGRFITDPASPRLLSYDNSEVIWDVGVQWRPSRRTSAQFTVGHRYGSMSYTGSLSWQPDPRTGVNISLYDSVDSFGRSLSGGLANLPGDFVVSRNPFSGDLTGCTFGTSTGSTCFSDTLSGIRTANFRHRGVNASIVHTYGPWRYGLGVGYSQRKFLGQDPVFAGLNGRKDENYYASAALGYAIDAYSGVDLTLYVNQFDSGINGVSDVFNAGGYLSYHRQLMRRLGLHASVGLDHVKASGVDAVLTALGQIGVRYEF